MRASIWLYRKGLSLLLLSLITLFAGPLLFQWLSRSHALAKTLDRGD
jgi:hypothetical protein